MKSNDMKFSEIRKEISSISKNIDDIKQNIPPKIDGIKNIVLQYSEQFVKKATSLEIWQARIIGAIVAISVACGISGIVLYFIIYFVQHQTGLTIL